MYKYITKFAANFSASFGHCDGLYTNGNIMSIIREYLFKNKKTRYSLHPIQISISLF